MPGPYVRIYSGAAFPQLFNQCSHNLFTFLPYSSKISEHDRISSAKTTVQNSRPLASLAFSANICKLPGKRGQIGSTGILIEQTDFHNISPKAFHYNLFITFYAAPKLWNLYLQPMNQNFQFAPYLEGIRVKQLAFGDIRLDKIEACFC